VAELLLSLEFMNITFSYYFNITSLACAMMVAMLLVCTCTCIQGLHGNVKYNPVKVIRAETPLVFLKTTFLRMVQRDISGESWTT